MTKRTRLVFNFFGPVLLLSISSVVGFAQTSGEMSGLVTDPSGANVLGATVTITNKATGATRNVTTNNGGLYSFPSLGPGIYQLKVEQAGFKTVLLDNIKIEVQQTARLDVSLEVGQVDERVTINSSVALLNSENTTLGTVIENKIVTELPLNGRSFAQLLLAAPGVEVDGGFSYDKKGLNGGADIVNETLTFPIWHFSGYIIASGRR